MLIFIEFYKNLYYFYTVNVPEYVTIIKPKMTNNNKIGNNTKNHETSLYPALHKQFNMKVQNNIYTALNTNITNVFGI